MSAFKVVLTAGAREDISGLTPALRVRILNRIRWLADRAGVVPHRALHGDVWRGNFRFRVGDYRIIYRLDRSTEVLTVLKVGHRRDVYR